MVSLSLSDEIESLPIAVWNYKEMTEPIKLTLGDGSIIVGQTLEEAGENQAKAKELAEEPLIPDHLTEEQWNDLIQKSTTFGLDHCVHFE